MYLTGSHQGKGVSTDTEEWLSIRPLELPSGEVAHLREEEKKSGVKGLTAWLLGHEQKEAKELAEHREARSRGPRATSHWAALTLATKGQASKCPKVIDLVRGASCPPESAVPTWSQQMDLSPCRLRRHLTTDPTEYVFH